MDDFFYVWWLLFSHRVAEFFIDWPAFGPDIPRAIFQRIFHYLVDLLHELALLTILRI